MRIIKRISSIFLLLIILTCNTTEEEDLTPLLAFFAFQQQAASASSSSATGNTYESIQTYYSTMTNLHVEVVYESDVEPYAGTFTLPSTTPGSFETKFVWNILEDNLTEMFKNRDTSVTMDVPKTTDSMTSISSQGKSIWTISDIKSLASTYRQNTSTETDSYFFIAFVDGYYSSDGSNAETGVIGVSITGTPYIAIFKQVVDSTGDSTTIEGQATRVYVEQATLIHEMGHALGLVNNGVSMVSDHEDTDNNKHCSNTTCVMYYANTGTSALVTFLKSYISSGSTVMLKSNCLEDTQSYKP
ncbi:MAG: hypothetical protein AAF518_13885 [Spirochaetota bacterium]